MTYSEDLAAAKIAGRAWACICGAENPPAYDACHDCQRPSWTCAACGLVSPAALQVCRECGNSTAAESLGDEPAFEMSHLAWANLQIGPRRVGGHYDHGSEDTAYVVTAIEHGPRDTWPSWQITVRYTKDGRTTTHCTGWDPSRDRVLAQPPADVVIVSVGRLHDTELSEHADILQRATIALDLRHHFRDPHRVQDLRKLSAADKAVREAVINTPGVRQVLAATALQISGYLAGPSAAPITVVTQCAGGRHRAATAALALRAVVAGDVEQAAEFGLDGASRAFTCRGLNVELIHRDISRAVVQR
ncbi:hypothetical protein [Streptomyces sp. NPDC097619]|uniref:RapZ C-terminal domain-containing protein n=1 Tax=Streptomyces sp. NPDC097619 TaxID=3157228 RepID=UPI00332A462D